jgi:hypothetical protein
LVSAEGAIMTVTVPASRKRRLQILDDETRDAPRFNLGALDGMPESEDLWVRNFMARLAASVRSLGGSQ